MLDSRGGEPEAVDEALGQLAEGLRLRPDDLVPLYYFAAFFFREQKTDAAVERLRGMLRGKAGKAEAHYYLGLMADRLGETDEAARQYREALRLDSRLPGAMRRHWAAVGQRGSKWTRRSRFSRKR